MGANNGYVDDEIYADGFSMDKLRRLNYGSPQGSNSVDTATYDPNKPHLPKSNIKYKRCSSLLKLARDNPKYLALAIGNALLVVGLFVAVIILGIKTCPECSPCKISTITTIASSTPLEITDTSEMNTDYDLANNTSGTTEYSIANDTDTTAILTTPN